MRQKIADRKGFTLAEILIVLAMIGLVTAAGVAATSAVLASRITMIQTADAQILASTAFQAVANELRFGQNIEVSDDGMSAVLDSVTYGPKTKLLLNDGKLQYSDNVKDQILSEDAYSKLRIMLDPSEKLFTQEADGTITIHPKVTGSKNTTLWSGDVSVTPLNQSAGSTTP